MNEPSFERTLLPNGDEVDLFRDGEYVYLRKLDGTVHRIPLDNFMGWLVRAIEAKTGSQVSATVLAEGLPFGINMRKGHRIHIIIGLLIIIGILMILAM